MTEPIEQLVVRLANEADAYHGAPDSSLGIEETYIFSMDELIAFAKACMLDQAEADEQLCDAIQNAHWLAFKRGHGPERANPYYDGKADGASECADAILKAAEGLRDGVKNGPV